jgi:hypothetical protein
MNQTKITFPDADKGYCCSSCGSYIKAYHRSFNSNMALCLLVLYKSGITDYVHLENLLLEKGYKRCGDFSYLVHFRLIEKLKEKRDDGSPRNGLYRITSNGIMFAEGKTTVQSKFIIQQNKLLGFEGKDINIKDALGTKFNYDILMDNN